MALSIRIDMRDKQPPHRDCGYIKSATEFSLDQRNYNGAVFDLEIAIKNLKIEALEHVKNRYNANAEIVRIWFWGD